MRKTIVLLFAALAFISAHAQNASVRGSINDTINKQNLSNTVIALLHPKDSVLYKFARSDKDGNFQLQHLTPGKYMVLITENGYADYIDSITLNNDSAGINLGTIPMTLKANLLKEVIVRQQIAAMRMKGDTLEFAADSFKVRQGASVEEMLKRLPGVQIDKDGKITAQGEQVEKVLVDGEEFFGDDPTVATRNIQADAIDKVQVFDKKSDQATFTGIDDGQKTKTINLKLKADKKKGSFGKLDVATDLQNKWNNSAMINNFKGKAKVSAYGIMSNTGKTGLNWEESDKYGSGSGMQYDDEEGGFYINFENDDDLNNPSYYGEGLPKSWSAGLNLSNKFNDEKQSLNGSYRYNKLNSLGSGKTISQSLLPDNFFVSRDSGTTFSSKQRHSLSSIYEWKIDSTTSLKFTGSGYTGTTLGSSIYNSFTNNEAGGKINDSRRNTSSTGDNQNLNLNFLLRKKFKKAGRSLSLNINELYNSASTDGNLYANIRYYDSLGVVMQDSLTDQEKKNSSRINTITSKITYTEPIVKKLFVEINYALKSYSASSKKLSYDRDQEGKFSQLNDIYSNDYRFDVLTNSGGAFFRYNGKKLTASAGSDIGFTNFIQKDLMNDTAYKRNYTNFFPRANFTFKINATSRISINYNGSTNQPTINQIQPVKDNTNPLIETVGNPNLKQEFSHRISFNANSYDVLNQRGFYIYGSFNTTSHAIVTDQTTDITTGKTTLKYFNRNGNYNFYSGGGYNLKLKKLNMNTNIGFNYTGSRFNNRVNGQDNVTINQAPGIRIGLGKDKEKKYNFYYNVNFNYNFSRSSIQENIKTNYWTQEHNLSATINLPWKIEINNELQFNLRQKTDLFTGNSNVFLWNAYVGRRLLKNDKAIIKIQGNDILNQNKGYSRSINSNTLTERNYETIRRYFMVAFTWNFSKTAMGTTPQQ